MHLEKLVVILLKLKFHIHKSTLFALTLFVLVVAKIDAT